MLCGWSTCLTKFCFLFFLFSAIRIRFCFSQYIIPLLIHCDVRLIWQDTDIMPFFVVVFFFIILHWYATLVDEMRWGKTRNTKTLDLFLSKFGTRRRQKTRNKTLSFMKKYDVTNQRTVCTNYILTIITFVRKSFKSQHFIIKSKVRQVNTYLCLSDRYIRNVNIRTIKASQRN